MSELIVATEMTVTDGDAGQYVMMLVGTQDIAFAIQDVSDAVAPRTITPIPLAPSAIAGVMNLRGRIVTVIDLRRILGGDGEGGRDYSLMTGITIDRPEGPFTVLVDSVNEVRQINRSLLEAPPATLEPALKRLCKGVFQLPDRLVVLLDVDRILDPETILATPTIPFRPRRNTPVIEGRHRNRGAPVDLPAELAEARPEPHVLPPPAEDALEDVLVPTNIMAHELTGGPIDTPPDLTPAQSVSQDRIAPVPSERVVVTILDGIGGEAALSKIVAAFYEEVLADPSLAGFYATADMSVQRARMVGALASLLATSGSNFAATAIGVDWLVPEKGMEDEHFNQCLAHFERALGRLAVGKTIGERFLTAIEWCREGVVD